MIKKILLLFIVVFILSNKALLANVEDPFTRSLGDGSELNQASSEEVENIKKSAKNDDATQKETVSQTEITSNQVKQPVSQPAVSKIEPIGNILAPNPLIAYDRNRHHFLNAVLSTLILHHQLRRLPLQ